MKMVVFMPAALCTAVAVAIACCADTTDVPHATGGAGGSGGEVSPSGGVTTSSASSGSSGQCLPLDCGEFDWGSNCRPTKDSCGNDATCACLNGMTCVHSDICCRTPDWYSYETQGTDRCSKIPGHPNPFVCGAIYGWDPAYLDAGITKPWVNDAGYAASPSAEPPPYCVEAPYQNDNLGWILWCCE